jgi:pimeloyl-ACP methyl ester carboxylesterase
MNLQLAALRGWFRIASVIAPGVAERQAASIFLTPRRRHSQHVARTPADARVVRLDFADTHILGWEWGEPTDPVVLLVHGWSGLATDMEILGRAVGLRGLRAIAFDMPAHGRSPGTRTSGVEWMRAMAAIQDWAGEIAAVVGHSFGTAALTFALEEDLRARCAVMISPAPAPSVYLERIARFLRLSPRRLPGMVRSVEAEVGRSISHFDPARAASDFDMPALLLHDPADDEVPYDQVLRLADAWPGATLELVHRVGHYRILRDSDVVERAADWISATLAAPRPAW